MSIGPSIKQCKNDQIVCHQDRVDVFNDMGPFIPVSGEPYEGGVANFDSKWDGGIGRFVFLGAEYRFQ
jgi:hypothetical protein